MSEAKEKCGYCDDAGWFMMSKPGQAIEGVLHMITFPQICVACPAGKRELEKINSLTQQIGKT